MPTDTIDRPVARKPAMKAPTSTPYLNIEAIQELAASLPIKLRTETGERLGAGVGATPLPGIAHSVHEDVLKELNQAIADKVYDLKARWEAKLRVGRVNPTDLAAYELR